LLFYLILIGVIIFINLVFLPAPLPHGWSPSWQVAFLVALALVTLRGWHAQVGFENLWSLWYLIED